MADVLMALTHYPVYNKHRETITSALTTIDVHDLARTGACYGARGLFVVTPLDDQRRLADEMIMHWEKGWGATYNPARKTALSITKAVIDLEQARRIIFEDYGVYPLLVGTSAIEDERRISFAEMRKVLTGDFPVLVVFGTAWGLTDEIQAGFDYILEPVKGPGNYNHLSVRSAAGIIMDRLLGR